MVVVPKLNHAELARAREVLENPELPMELANLAGRPIEALVRRLPAFAQKALAGGTQRGLETCLGLALRTLGANSTRPPSNWTHRALVLGSGALGGAAGIAGLALELPFSLSMMLRSIADHARAQGEDLTRVSTRLECLTVFAYGTPSRSDEPGHTGYLAVRSALAGAVSQSAAYVTERGVAEALSEGGSPALVTLVALIGRRLGVAVTDKAAAQLLPILGAAGGAGINFVFMNHYQKTAAAHFTIRRLERECGAEEVRKAYEGMD